MRRGGKQMKLLQTPPSVDVMLEVTAEEAKRLEERDGLMFRVETKSGKQAYYWRIQGMWALVTVKEAKEADSR